MFAFSVCPQVRPAPASAVAEALGNITSDPSAFVADMESQTTTGAASTVLLLGAQLNQAPTIEVTGEDPEAEAAAGEGCG